MPGEHERNLPHVFVTGRTTGHRYTNPQTGGGSTERFHRGDRAAHAAKLVSELDAIRRADEQERETRQAAGLPTDFGLVLEFVSHPALLLENKSLERRKAGIELLNLRTRTVLSPDGTEMTQELAAVRVPYGKLAEFEKLVAAYRGSESKPGSGKPKNEPLIAPIDEIRRAAVDAFWTDHRPMPADGVDLVWEAWLRSGAKPSERSAVESTFTSAAERAGIRMIGKPYSLPETTIRLIRATRAQIQRSVELLDCLRELRLPAEGAAVFIHMTPSEQAAWVLSAVERLQPPPVGANAVCLLDTGVNHLHPLLAPVVAADGLHTYLPAWGTDDPYMRGAGHGTQMAGLAAFGDLTRILPTHSPIVCGHWIESAKIFNDRDPQPGDQWGNVVSDAVAAVEQAAPNRARVFAQQITALDSGLDGRPTAWSAATDKLCAAVDEEPKVPRLLFISAGNCVYARADQYPARNREKSIDDPAQAWNAVTVGACTHRDRILDPAAAHLSARAPRGALSPTSTSSACWADDWPIKPDVVMEGGNRAVFGDELDCHPDLELLTTNAAFSQRQLCTADGTSAASAQAARIAGLIQRTYPNLWPETVRALVVHSAEWTDAMADGCDLSRKESVEAMLRLYGHGQADALRALRTARNAVTLIVQDEFQPFAKIGGSYVTNEMRLHQLPWPKDALERISSANVEMRVTLSYFIEPNPGPRLTNNRYRYGSCHLRFEVQRPAECLERFCARVNKADRQADYVRAQESDSSRWRIGSDCRHRGSLHQDTWFGHAADLASKPSIAVYPVNGWWRLRHHLGRYNSRIRYALVVSIRSPEQAVDLYTPIVNQIAMPVAVPGGY